MSWFYDIGPLVGVGLNAVLAFFVLRQNLHRRLNQVFSVFLIGMGLWAFFVFGMRHSPTLEQAIPWERATFAVLPVISVTFFHFVSLFIGNRKITWQIPVAYASIILAVALAPTDLLLAGMKTMWYGHGFEPGILLFPYMFIFYGIVIISLLLLLRAYRKLDSGLERNRYAYITIGAVVCILGLLVDVFAAQGLGIYPMGIFSNIIFSLLCAYAILRYQLLDITVIIRKGTTYILVSALAIGVYLGLLIIAYNYISGAWSLPLWLNITFILIFAIGLQPLLRWAQNTVDRWFYRGRYDYLNALEGLAEKTKAITDLDFIANAIVSTITNAMRCENVLVLLPDTENKYYISPLQQGEKKPQALRFNRDSALIWWMSQNKGFLTRQDITVLPQLKALTEQERHILDELNAVLFIPLTTREGLRGILILGRKLSEQDYSPEEIKLLRVAANQMATIVENARLYDLQTRRYREQSLLARFSMTVAAELDFSKVFNSLMNEIQDVVSVNYAVLMLADEQETKPPDVLEYSQIPDFHPDILKGLFSPENVAQVGESRYEPDIWQENFSSLYEPLTKAGLRSLLYLPLLSKGNVTGYLAIASKETDAYNEDYIRLLKQIAVQMAIAYEKSHLYELERKARLELEKQDKERTEFINSLIHEIKTPITAMLASCDLLSEELATSPGVLGELAENLSTAINNLNRRVSELTDFAKLQNTEMKVNLQKVDMHKMTERADSLISSLLQSRNQMLNFDLKAMPHIVKADPDRVIQVLLNLLTNASKYGKPYKEIYLKTYNSGGYLVTEVKDSAAPLLAEDKESLFRPYNLARKKESGGLGLGLFVCKKLVELHGGKIWLEADVSGNQFKFSLPLITQEEGN